MKRLIPLMLIGFCLIACDSKEKTDQKEDARSEESSKIKQLKDDFIADLWKNYPSWATYVGFHEYDEVLSIPNAERRSSQKAFADKWLANLEGVKLDELAEGDRIDLLMMKDFLNGIHFDLDGFKAYQWNPASYNLGGSFFQVLNFRGNALEDRLEDLNQKLASVPNYYQAAKENIERPTKIHTELAISQIKGSLSIFERNLIDSLQKSNMDETFKVQFKGRVDSAVMAIQAFANYLENDLYPSLNEENSRDFRIGKELFEKKFYYDIQSAYSAEEIFRIAVEEKSKLHDNMYRLSEMLWEKYFGEAEKPGKRLDQIRMVIDEVAKDHVHRDSFITAIREQIPQLEEFIRQNDLLELDPEKPLVVRETPKYMQGVAGASISAPGPYDKDAETYYNVTPLDHYSEEEAESYLREYNRYVLQILNIHEAIPGHYTQLVYSNESPSIIKSILGNGAMIEGWAVYTEMMMLEAGYGGDHLEMGLMYYKWNLRTVCNTILDYGVHVNDFNEADAMQLLVKEAFQEETEAKGKWKRARLSQVQLCSYFTGYHEIRELRDSIMSVEGNDFDLKEFHQEFLSYGSAPVKYIARMMLQNVGKSREESSVSSL